MDPNPVDWCPYKRRRWGPRHTGTTMWGHGEETAVCMPRREASVGTSPVTPCLQNCGTVNVCCFSLLTWVLHRLQDQHTEPLLRATPSQHSIQPCNPWSHFVVVESLSHVWLLCDPSFLNAKYKWNIWIISRNSDLCLVSIPKVPPEKTRVPLLPPFPTS